MSWRERLSQRFPNMARHGAILREAARLVDAGKLSVHLHAGRFTLAEANEAHAASGGGKVVVEIG